MKDGNSHSHLGARSSGLDNWILDLDIRASLPGGCLGLDRSPAEQFTLSEVLSGVKASCRIQIHRHSGLPLNPSFGFRAGKEARRLNLHSSIARGVWEETDRKVTLARDLNHGGAGFLDGHHSPESA